MKLPAIVNKSTGDLLQSGRSLVFLLLLFLIDEATRFLCFERFCPRYFTSWFGFTQFRNYDFAFSLKIPIPVIYVLYGLVVSILIMYLIRQWRVSTEWIRFSWLLVLVGALANILDRIFLGYVRDFIHVGNGFFNMGDVWIVLGVVYICLFSLYETRA